MISVTYIDYQTPIRAVWLNGVDRHATDQETGAHTAANITNVPFSDVTSDNVQGALQQLDTKIESAGGGLEHLTETYEGGWWDTVLLGSKYYGAVAFDSATGAPFYRVRTFGTQGDQSSRGSYSIDFQVHRDSSVQVAGDDCAIMSGYANSSVNGWYSFIGNGQYNTNKGYADFIGAGDNNTTDATNAYIPGGGFNYVDSFNGGALGHGGKPYGSDGVLVLSSWGTFDSSPNQDLSNTGRCQTRRQVQQSRTTNSTPIRTRVRRTSNESAKNALFIPENSSGLVTANVIARTSDGQKSFILKGMINRNTASNVAIVGQGAEVIVNNESGTGAWAATLAVNTTYQILTVLVTGPSDRTVVWTADITYTEVNSDGA
jgi:hypothetical protein